MTKRRILFTKIHEKAGKRYQATTWDCTPPGNEDAYELSRTEWKLLSDAPNQLTIF
jgi:hypothetical protein